VPWKEVSIVDQREGGGENCSMNELSKPDSESIVRLGFQEVPF